MTSIAFGATVQLTVDRSNGAEFRRQIQEHVDKSTAPGGGVKLKNITIALDQQKQAEMRERLQNYLANSKFTIKVSKIDAAAAITELKQQIRTEVMGLTSSTSRAGGTVKAPDVSVAHKELNMLARGADSIYRRVSSMGGVQADDIVRRYRELSIEIQKARTLEGQALTEATAGIQQKVAALRTEMEAITSIDKIEQQRVGTLKQISQYEGKLGDKLAKTLPGRSQSVGDELSGLKLDARVASTGDELTGVRNRYLEVAAAAKAAGLEAQSFGSVLQGEASKLSVWALATTMIMGAVKAVKDMVENVKRLDAEMIELIKTADLTKTQVKDVTDEAAIMARSVGATLADTIRAEAEFTKLGYSMDGQVQALTKAAIVYKTAGDGIRDIGEASSSIVSAMKAFGFEDVKEAMRIVDAYNLTSDRFAISAAGIGEAMSRSSAALAAANNAFEESVALVIAGNSTVQNPEVVGTALKTLSMRLRGAKVELEAAGESTEGMATSVSKLRTSILALTGAKVDIQIDADTYKSSYQILKEIAAIWDDLKDIDQAALLELISGKNSATVAASILSNFADAEKALAVAANSAGSSIAQNEQQMSSLGGRLVEFSAAFEDLSRKVINDDLFKGLVDQGTKFIDVLAGITDVMNKMTGGLGGVPVAVAAITGAMGIMSKSGVKGGPFDFAPGDLQKAAESIKAFGAHIQQSIKDVGLFKTGLGETRGAMQGIGDAARHAGNSLKSFRLGFTSPKDAKALLGYAKELNTINDAQAAGLIDIAQNNELAAEAYQRHIASVDGLKASTITTAAAMKSGAVNAKEFAAGAGAIGAGSRAAAVGLKALSIAANMLFNMAIAAVISAVIKGIDNLIHRAEIAAEKAREAANAANEAAAKQEEGYRSLASLVEAYRSLSATGRIDTANLEKAKDIQNQIVKIVGRQVDGLDLVNGASEAQLKILKEQLRLRAEDARISATAAYNASVKATEKAQPQEKGFLGLYRGAFNAKHWANADEKAARDALKTAGLWKEAFDTIRLGLLDEIFPSPDYTITLDFDMDGNKLDTVFKKLNYLRELIKALENDENIDVTRNSVYLGLVQQLQAFETAAAPNIEASVRLLESVSLAAELASDGQMKAVKSLTEFEALRGDLIKKISGNASLAGPLKSGAIELGRVEAAVDSILARNLPEWFDAARDAAEGSAAAFVDAGALIASLGESIDEVTKRRKVLQAAMSDMGDPAGNGGISADTVKSIQDALDANEKLIDYISAQNGVLKLNTQAWNARTFGDIQSQIDRIREANRALEEQNAQLIANSGAANILDLLSGKYAAATKQIEENTAKLEENQEALGIFQALYNQLAFVDVWDFTNMANDLGSVQSAAGGLVSAMQQLKDGTALTRAELAKLAIQYPELLSASNLFADGSIAGQKRILDAALQAYEAQYDAEIDKDIAILEATHQLLQDQIDLEDEKSAILAEIDAKEATGRVADAAWLQERLSEFNDLEGKNYVSMEDGKLRVNQEALEKTLAQTASYGRQSSTIWSRIATNIASWFASIAQKARNLAKVIANALTGKQDDSDINAGTDDPLLLKDSDLLRIEGQAVSEWTSQQEAILAQRREVWRKEVDKTLAMIDNLRKIKGLDLTSIYGSTSGASKSAGDLDKLTAAGKRLAEFEKQIERESDPHKRIALRRQMIGICKEELAAEDALLGTRREVLDAAVEELRQLGFVVERNDETNRLHIANMERLNEIVTESQGEYGSLLEATDALRQGTRELIDQVEGWSETNVYASETIDGLRDAMQKAKEGILSDLAEIRKAAEDALKEVVSAYDTLSKASALDNLRGGNIGEAFFPTVSTFQAIMSMESKYLNYLHLESGAITMNRAALKKLTAAKVEDLAVTQAMNLVDTIELHRDDTEVLRQMAGATQQATNATWDLVYARLAQQNLDKDLNDAFLKQINTMRQLSKRTQIGITLGFDDSSIQNMLSGVFNKIKSLVSDVLKEIKAFVEEFIRTLQQTYKDMLSKEKSGLDEVLKLTMDLIKYEVGQKIDGLKEQIKAYKEIVDLKKKELDLARQQAKYEEGVAERVADIARLQAEIAQLKLDDSREAAALRAAKEKELADKQKDLADYQDDHAYDAQVRALDDAADAYEKAKQKEIEELEKTISSTEKIYQLAVKRLEEDFWGLYAKVIDWNTEAGSSINKEITAAWKEAAKAVTLYMGYLNAVNALELQLKIQADGIGAVIADALVNVFSGFFSKTYDMFAGFLNKFLGIFGVQLPTGASTGTTGLPINPGTAMLGLFGDVVGGAINGIVNGVKGFVSSMFSKFPFFHSGGHVGGKVRGRTSDPAEEVIAVLQTDEVVLTKQQQKNLLTQLDFLRELGANVDHLRWGSFASLCPIQNFVGPEIDQIRSHINNHGSITVSAPVEVIIQHSGAMDDATAARFGKKVSETAVGSICEAFRKKGIHPGAGNTALKP